MVYNQQNIDAVSSTVSLKLRMSFSMVTMGTLHVLFS